MQNSFLVVVFLALISMAGAVETPQAPQSKCLGDTRGDSRCNHDPTHRVCAKIGDPDTSFWEFTHQSKWCGKSLYGRGLIACPESEPTWCICKWATAHWIQGETCNERINIDCDATDICATDQGLYFSYKDFDVNLHPARECVMQKCPDIWEQCDQANGAETLYEVERRLEGDD